MNDQLPTKNKLNWSWLRNLLKLLDECKSKNQLINKVRNAFTSYLNFETFDILITESNQENDSKDFVERLAGSLFFNRNVIEDIFIERKPCKVSKKEIVIPLENSSRIIGLAQIKSSENLSNEETELLWSFCDLLAEKINSILIPMPLNSEAKNQLREISNSIFNNLRGFLEASLERLKILEEQNQQLVKINETRTELINNVSHELRTPLVSIIGFSKILQRREIETELVKEASEQIQSAGSRLSRMIDDLIQLNRASTKGWEVNVEKLDIGEIARFVIESLSPLNKEHKFTFAFPDDYPLVEGDRKLLRQVIENLLLNAIKYSPNGGEIKCSINTNEKNRVLEFAVHDEGIGMTQEESDKIFDRFYRAKNEHTENIPGLGLGLSICKDVLEALGGTIKCQSQYGSGSVFTTLLKY